MYILNNQLNSIQFEFNIEGLIQTAVFSAHSYAIDRTKLKMKFLP